MGGISQSADKRQDELMDGRPTGRHIVSRMFLCRKSTKFILMSDSCSLSSKVSGTSVSLHGPPLEVC